MKKLRWLLLLISLHGFLSYLMAVYYRNTNFFDIWENPSFVFTDEKSRLYARIRQKQIEQEAREERDRRLQEEYTQFISNLNREFPLMTARRENIYEIENNAAIDRRFPGFRSTYYRNIRERNCNVHFRGPTPLPMHPCTPNRWRFLNEVIRKAGQNTSWSAMLPLATLWSASEREVFESPPRGEIPISFDLYRIFPEDFAFVDPGVFSGWIEWNAKFEVFLEQDLFKAFLYILYGIYTVLTMVFVYAAAIIWICIAAVLNESRCCNNHYCNCHN